MAVKFKKKKSSTVPYDKLADDEKVRKNWHKAIGLYQRREWSVSIIRCATCLELAVNFAIREELVDHRELPLPFVNKLLTKANGIHNKYQNIYLPIMDEYQEAENLKVLWSEAVTIVNSERNAVAHRGEFRSKAKATAIMEHTHRSLTEILRLHSSEAKIRAFET